MTYEAVIGLEVHVQIKTRSKMFTRVPAGYGEPENTLTDPTVLALPGALPVMNRAAVDAIIKAGLLLGCEIAPVCKWDRKNYFYPDSPKNYQISQYDQPICLGGAVEIELPGPARNIQGEHKSIPLTRIHLEEDVGKLNHGAGGSLIDYNRAGTPLMEIVSDPAIHSAEEAYAYLTSLRNSIVYAGISDCDMEKGQLRCDANISIRPVGATALGTKVELKNLNSISFVRDGIAHEIARQIAVVKAGGVIVQETRDYDGLTGTSQSLRSKEMAHDYRYFPDPDLMPVKVDAEWKARLAAELPERPFDKQRRFMAPVADGGYALPYTLASVLIPERELSDFFEATAKQVKPELYQSVGNWIANEFLKLLSEQVRAFREHRASDQFVEGKFPKPVSDFDKELRVFRAAEAEPTLASVQAKITPAALAELVKLIDAGTLLQNAAKDVFAELFASGEAPAAIVTRKGLAVAQTDSGELEQWCRDAIAANAKAAEEFRAGKESAINGLKGPVMKAAKGKVNPKLVDETLRRVLAAM
jgi:aspartyl-tRNA(Asn)/glutamyl-tRNA(Gln) amidotransferase subunit B